MIFEKISDRQFCTQQNLYYMHLMFKIHRIFFKLNYYSKNSESMIQIIYAILFILTYSRSPQATISKMTFQTTYEANYPSQTNQFAELQGDYVYLALLNDVIEQRQVKNYGNLVGVFNDTLTFGLFLYDMVVVENLLISVHQTKLIVAWNITTKQIVRFTYTAFQIFRILYLTNIRAIIGAVNQDKGFHLIDFENFTVESLVYNVADYTANHRFEISPNQQFLVDWDFSGLLRVYNITSFPMTVILEYTANISSLHERYRAYFKPNSQQFIFGDINGNLVFHYLSQQFRPSKFIKVFPVPRDIRQIIQYNQQQQIFFITSDNQTIIYDMTSKTTLTVPSTYSIGVSVQFTKDKRYFIKQFRYRIKVVKILCDINYFYDNVSSLCLPCSVNNCSQCQSQFGNCTACPLSNQFLQQGRCQFCEQSCLKCENQTGHCLECQYPFIVTSDSSCGLETSYGLMILRYTFAVISVTKMKPTYSLIASMNQLELYNYHKRQYGNNMRWCLEPIHFIEIKKWFVIPTDNLNYMLSSVHFSSEKKQYTSQKKFTIKQDQSFDFWNCMFEYCFWSVPQTILIFLFLRTCFLCIFNFKASVLFRQYSFYLFLMPCLFSNHLEYLTYAACNQFQYFFSSMWWDKFRLILFVLFFFCIILYIFLFFWLVLIYHSKTRKYFFDNIKPSLPGTMSISFATTWRTFLLSAIQSFSYQYYYLQMSLMILVQIVSLTVLLLTQKSSSCFDRKNIFSNYMSQFFIMILLDSILMVDYYYRSNGNTNQMGLTDYISYVILCCLTINIIVYIIGSLIPEMKNKPKTDTLKKKISKRKISPTTQAPMVIDYRMKREQQINNIIDHNTSQRRSSVENKLQILSVQPCQNEIKHLFLQKKQQKFKSRKQNVNQILALDMSKLIQTQKKVKSKKKMQDNYQQ